jgi:small subunit ribosomal protein S1
MIDQKGKYENPIATIDEGWWSSVLAEEGRFSVHSTVHRAGNKPGVQKAARPASIHAEVEAPAETKHIVNWESAKDFYARDQIINLIVTGKNRGGLLVEGQGLSGFVPFSHLLELAGKTGEVDRDHDLEAYRGRSLKLKIIECVPEDDRIVFSERAAQTQTGTRTELFHSLQPGQQTKGVVTNVTDFGVFVDLGGVEGLIHISELSWGRVSHPAQIVKVGSTIEVQVLDLAPERCRVGLSLKRLLHNPWQNTATEFPLGCVRPATITSILSFGAFARLDAGIEGLIHSSEIPQAEIQPIKEFLTEGQNVQVRVLHLDAAHQRIGLSMRLD